MSNSEDNIANIPLGKLKLTGHAPTFTTTPTPGEIKSAIESTSLTAAKIYIVMKILDHIVNKGLVNIDEFISKIYCEFKNDPEAISTIIEAVKSMTHSI